MSKPTGLSAFTRKGAATSKKNEVTSNRDVSATLPTPVRRRERGKGDTVALTIRLTRAEWERVHQLAVSEGASIQSLTVDGLSKIFVEKGLPGLNA